MSEPTSTSAPGPTIVITGASDGIGAVAARELARSGARLVITGRSESKLAAVARDTGATPVVGDFSRFEEVRRVADEIRGHVDRIDVLVNNAGGTFSPRRLTPDGHDPNLQVNHLAGFLLTHLLRDRLVAGPASEGRKGALVLNTSSVANLFGRVRLGHLDAPRWGPEMYAYGTSKLMNILFTRGIAQRWSADGIVSVAVHPGPVATSFGRDSFVVGLIYRTPLRQVALITPEQGAAPLVALALGGPDPAVNGTYFSQHTPHGLENPQAKDATVIEGLWRESAALVGLDAD